jgi:hypothetical protein
MKPTLKPPGPKRWKLKCDLPLSIFAFKFNLRRYTKDWSHPGDYLWPPSIHSWRVGQCRTLAAHVREVLSAEHGSAASGEGGGVAGIPYLHALIEDDPARFSKVGRCRLTL